MTRSDERAILVAADIDKSFGETHALRSCSLAAMGGEIHALIGENGSGKSTLAKVLAGILPPDSGAVNVLGGCPKSPLEAQTLGLAMVCQEVLVAEGCSVLDNLFMGYDGLLRARGSMRAKRAQGAELLNRLLGFDIDLRASIEDFPLSVRQWVVVARALLRNPKILILDESTAALDIASVERFYRELLRLREGGTCVVLVTHRIAEVMSYVDRITVLRDGTNVATLDAKSITETGLLELMSGGSQRRVVDAACTRTARCDSTHPVLRVSDVRVRPNSEPINLDLLAGEIVGVAGLDGQGQARFIRTLAGIERAATGQVVSCTADGDVALNNERSARKAGIAYISGDRKLEALFPNLCIFENFAFSFYGSASVAGFIDSRFVRRKFTEQVEELSIRLHRGSDGINSLSGGNQQKVVIGRCLAGAPAVLLLNDPTRGVDVGTKRDLYKLLARLADDGKAILFLSNENEEFIGLCDRVLVFRDGSVFTSLEGADITVDRILAALFGYESASIKAGASVSQV